MKKLSIASEVFMVPESFAECSVGQISGVLVAQQTLKIAKDYKNADKVELVKLSILFCLVPNLSMDGWKVLTWWQKMQVMGLVRWAFFAKVERRPFEYFEHDGIKYYLPEEGYADTSALEWALCSIYYIAFTNKENRDSKAVERFFYLLLATVCRPERADIFSFKNDVRAWNGDSRDVFNSSLTDARADVFKNVPYGVLVAVFQYWEKMNSDFTKRNKELFEGGDEAPMFLNGEGCLSMLEDIAEDGVHGTLEKVNETNIANIFMYMRHKQVKVKRAERIARRNNKEE